MLKVLFLIIISVVMLNQVNGQTEKFKHENLSPNGQKAYQKLLETMFFIEPIYQEEDEIPEELKSFNVLLDEKDADKAFKSLLTDAGIAGQLYALCAIYYTDNDFFKKSVEKYRGSETMVVRVSKDLKFWFKIDTIIHSTEPNVAIIPPNETLQEFWKRIEGGYFIDIAHGGFSASFRRYKDWEKEKD